MEELAGAAVTGVMSTGTLIWIIGGLMAIITVLGNLAKSLVERKTNPLNGTLVKLNETLVKIDMRTGDSDRALEGHTEKLIVLGTTMAQLAANEAAQTQALLQLKPAIERTITGCANRITDNCAARSGAILTALDKR